MGLIGDYDPDVMAHQAIPPSLRIAGGLLNRVVEETWLSTIERYQCQYGMNRDYLKWFTDADMAVTAFDERGDPRAVELRSHPFFVGTAYQPERRALAGQLHPLVFGFVEAAAKHL